MGTVEEGEEEEAGQEQLVLHSLTKAPVNRLEALILNLEPELRPAVHTDSASELIRFLKLLGKINTLDHTLNTYSMYCYVTVDENICHEGGTKKHGEHEIALVL